MDLLSLLEDPPAISGAGVTEPASGPTGPTGRPPLRLRSGEPPAPRVARLPVRQRPTLLAVDGDSLAHRAWHGYGEGADAEYGFLALLAAIADQVPFAAAVIGFDAPSETSWRRRRWPAYKAQRPEKPPSLARFLSGLPGSLADLGIHVEQVDGHEADDVLGSSAHAASARGWCSVLATSDRDAYSLVDDVTTVLRLRSGIDNALVVTPRELRRTVGVDGAQYVMLAALRGDPSDNLPGVCGIGASRAAALLDAFGTIEAAVADEIGCRSVLGPELGAALIADLAGPDSVVRRNVALMTISRDVPVDLEAAARRPPADALHDRLVARGLGAVAGRMAAAFGARPEAPPPPEAPLAPSGDAE